MLQNYQRKCDESEDPWPVPARNWCALLVALRTAGPEHVAGQPDWVEFIATAASETDDFYSEQLYEVATCDEEGVETTALLAACEWLHNVKEHIAMDLPFHVPTQEIARLKLTHIDQLVARLSAALLSPEQPVS